MLDNPTESTSAGAVHDRVVALIGRLEAADYHRIEVPILQDAEPFLALVGEEIRASLYFTSDRTGTELCLRPEYTIPVCRSYLGSGRAGAPATFSYCGPVFRYKAGQASEVVQAGLESFGRDDRAAADAEVLGLALEAATAAGAGPLRVTFGDAGLLTALLDALRLPSPWQRRLRRGLDKGEATAAILAAAPSGTDRHSGVLAALAGADETGARALVDDLLAIAGIDTVGGRSAGEIADRFLSQVALRSAPPFSDEQRSILDRFLAVTGHPDAAAGALRDLAHGADLDLGRSLDLFEERTGFMAAHGVDLDAVTFSAAFGRKLDYYTGFVFEARQGAGGLPVVGGGRYDRLAQQLDKRFDVPAVGAAIWPERLGASKLALGAA